MRTATRKYRVKIPNALKLLFPEMLITIDHRGLDRLDRLASTRGKAISSMSRMIGFKSDIMPRSEIWNTASRIGQLENKRAECKLKKSRKAVLELGDADKNLVLLHQAKERQVFCKKHMKPF